MNQDHFKKKIKNYFQVHDNIRYLIDTFNEKCDEIWIGSRQNKKFQTQCKNTHYFKENLKILTNDIDVSDMLYYCSECVKEIEYYFRSTNSIKKIRFFNLDSNMQANIIALEKIIYPQLNSQLFQHLYLKIKKFEGDSMKQLYLILSQSKYLEHLSLYLEKASQPHQLENGLKDNKSLRSIYLDFGQLKLNSDQKLIQSVINGISQNDTLETAYLNLSECDIQNVNLGKIFSKISQLKTLILNLYSAETNSNSLKLFGMGMKQGKSIEELVILLEKIYIRAGEAQEFSLGLQCLQNLKKLELTIRENRMSDDNVQTIAKSLSKIQNLKNIKLRLGQEFENEIPNIMLLLQNKIKMSEIKVKLPFNLSKFSFQNNFPNDEYLRTLSLKFGQHNNSPIILPSILSSKINLQKLVLKGCYQGFSKSEEIGFQINKLQQLEHLEIKSYLLSLDCFQHIKQLPHLKYFKIETSNIQNSEKQLQSVEQFVNNCPLLDKIHIKIQNYTLVLKHQFSQITLGPIYRSNISEYFPYINGLISNQKKLLKFQSSQSIYRLNSYEIQLFIEIIEKILDPQSQIWYFDFYERREITEKNIFPYFYNNISKDQLNVFQIYEEISQGLKYEFYKILAFNNEIRDELLYNPLYIYYDLYF